jgi:exoribonuclease-2
MDEAGFNVELSEHAARELALLKDVADQEQDTSNGIRDMRELLWSSIDNTESRDLDQIEYAEALPNGQTRLRVGIADVDAFVPKGSALDRHAAMNATSLYLGVSVFPMLPEALSEGLTSLLPEEDRLAIVTELIIADDGSVAGVDAWRALVRNHAKLAYEPVGAWLEKRGPEPRAITAIPGLREQVMLQYNAMECLERYREQAGALSFETVEARPVAIDGVVVDIVLKEENEARDLIEDVMVTANSGFAHFLKSKGYPAIQRLVREPDRWKQIVMIARRHGDDLPEAPDSRALAAFLRHRKLADPAGYADLSMSVVKLLGAGEYAVVTPDMEDEQHFGLAVHGYSRSTAPNRRYIDLVTQRLLKGAIAGKGSPYSIEELQAVADLCRDRERAARKVERRVRKSAAAILLDGRTGDTFDGIVTGATPKGTFVRLFHPPAEGRVVRGEDDMRVGDRVRVRLLGTDIEKGFIDFARA